MPNRYLHLAAFLAVFATMVFARVSAAAAVEPAPLFAADADIHLSLTLPLRTLLRERSSRPDVRGTIDYAASIPGGADQHFDVIVTTRGHDRLRYCSFPPLRLELRGSPTSETLFAQQKRLKLVTLCKENSNFERYLELEYFAYRLYAALTDAAFRVRRVHMNYVDTEREDSARDAPAFFLESVEAAARRVGMVTASLPKLAVDTLDSLSLARFALFQFLIGNTDWAVTAASAGEVCCHNAEVLAPAKGGSGFVLLPYDFDHAGIVDAEYAAPHPGLGITSVRQRLYRGFCRSNSDVGVVVEQFNAARPAIDELLATLTPDARVAASRYLARSYEILNDDGERQRQIFGRCRKE